MKRNLYLDNTPPDEALKKYRACLEPLPDIGTETVASREAAGRVTAHAVTAVRSSPLYNSAAMDGIAVIAAATAGARETAPVTLLRDRDYRIVDTGDPVRPPFDAVIMAEDISEIDGTQVQIYASAACWQHVRPIGEDIVTGELILPSRHVVRPVDVGVLLSAGITEIEVRKRPSVAVIPTGTELIEPGAEPREGDIIDSNSYLFCSLIAEAGAKADRLSPVPDDYDKLRDAIQDAARTHDMILVNAGSSAGTEDYTVHVLRALGSVAVHGVAMKPGKPVILAVIEGKPVIGLPGYPVSAYLAYTLFAQPILCQMSGLAQRTRQTLDAVLARRLNSSLKYREYVRVKIGYVDGRAVASPLARGAGSAMSLVRADGVCVIPQEKEGYEAGETVQVTLWRAPEELRHTLVVTGSHDMILDVLADLMAERYPGLSLSATHVGSTGGLIALARGEAHIAPCHLLDEKTGVYNLAAVRSICGAHTALIRGVGRVQGILVKKGNPLGIRGVLDLPGVRYVNRQRGAGTRVLFDHLLKENGLSPADITGYDREAATHLAVAALVRDQSADAGMGVLSAARAMGLDFIEVGTEEYDFAVRQRDLALPEVQAFLELLTGSAFAGALEGLGGYTWDKIGQLIPTE